MRAALRAGLFVVILLAAWPPWLLTQPGRPSQPWGHHAVTWAPKWPTGLAIDVRRLGVEILAVGAAALFVGEVLDAHRRRRAARPVITITVHPAMRRSDSC